MRESYREAGKVKKRTLLLSGWSHGRIAGFKALLKGGTNIPKGHDGITIIRSLPHGHVDAALGTARRIVSASIGFSAQTATATATLS